MLLNSQMEKTIKLAFIKEYSCGGTWGSVRALESMSALESMGALGLVGALGPVERAHHPYFTVIQPFRHLLNDFQSTPSFHTTCPQLS